MRQSIRGYTDAVFEQAAAVDGGMARLASELAAVRELLAASEDLRQALIDPGLQPSVRRGIVEDLWGSRLDALTVGLLVEAVETDTATEFATDVDWMATRAAAVRDGQRPVGEVVLGRTAALERVAGYANAVLKGVEGENRLGDVEDELFRFMRVVDGTSELQTALTTSEVSAESRRALVADLLGSRATATTTRLASYVTLVGRPREYLNDLSWLVDRVAAESNRRVAEVRSATELGSDERSRLGAALGQITGRTVEVRVTVDPTLIAGFVATIGDTVVDASAAHRLALLKERLILPEATVSTTGDLR